MVFEELLLKLIKKNFFLVGESSTLNRSSKYPNMCYGKNQVFLKFTINYQSKLK